MNPLHSGARSWWLGVRARWLGACAAREIDNGRYEKAERLARGALNLDEGAGDPIVALLNTLGMACKYQGKYRDGRRAYLRALALAHTSPAPDPSAIASLYHNLGGLEHARGGYRRSEPLARHAVALRERALGPDIRTWRAMSPRWPRSSMVWDVTSKPKRFTGARWRCSGCDGWRGRSPRRSRI